MSNSPLVQDRLIRLIEGGIARTNGSSNRSKRGQDGDRFRKFAKQSGIVKLQLLRKRATNWRDAANEIHIYVYIRDGWLRLIGRYLPNACNHLLHAGSTR